MIIPKLFVLQFVRMELTFNENEEVKFLVGLVVLGRSLVIKMMD